MNKQELAFLTMFSLILMLSVYYVTLPSDTTAVMKENTPQEETGDSNSKDKIENKETKTGKQEESKDTSKVNEAAKLQEEIDKKKDSEINKNSSVLSKGDADETAKKQALTTMEELKDDKEMQQKVAQALSKEKLNVAVEIKDNTCIVNVFDKKDEKKLANEIMKTVSEVTNQKYFIEVTFK